jgi:hypothetical protein
MDIENFTRQAKPRKNGSQLLRFQKEIGDLKRRSYSDELIREWLAQNGISVSRENVRKFIKRHLRKLNTMAQPALANDTVVALCVDRALPVGRTVNDIGENSLGESPAQRIQRLAREQRDDAEKSQFQHDKIGNNH